MKLNNCFLLLFFMIIIIYTINDTIVESLEVHCDPNSFPQQKCPGGKPCDPKELTCTDNYCICPSQEYPDPPIFKPSPEPSQKPESSQKPEPSQKPEIITKTSSSL